MLSSAPLAERSHSGLVRRFAKPLKGVSSSEGSNPSLSAIAVAHVPVAQWIERQVADLKVVGSSPAGRAISSMTYRSPTLVRTTLPPFAASVSSRPKLLMTVATSVFSCRWPDFSKSTAAIARKRAKLKRVLPERTIGAESSPVRRNDVFSGGTRNE